MSTKTVKVNRTQKFDKRDPTLNFVEQLALCQS